MVLDKILPFEIKCKDVLNLPFVSLKYNFLPKHLSLSEKMRIL